MWTWTLVPSLDEIEGPSRDEQYSDQVYDTHPGSQVANCSLLARHHPNVAPQTDRIARPEILL